MQKIEEIKLLEVMKQDPLSVFGLLNIDLKDCGSYFQGVCPIHSGDNHSAFVYYKDTGRWVCFTHSCNAPRDWADLIDLCAKIWKVKRGDAVEKLNMLYSTNGIDVSKTIFNNAIKPTRKYTHRDIKVIESSVLDKFDEKYDFYMARGYSEQTLRNFDVKYCGDIRSRFYNRMIIPIHTSTGELVGWSGRWCGDFKNEGVEKFLHTWDLPKTKLLYNWHRAEKFFASKQVILVESPGAVWGLHQIGVYNAIAVLGCAISAEQARIVVSCNTINSVILAFDPDKAGSEAMTERSMSVRNLKNRIGIQVIKLDQGKDFDNISLQDFKLAFANRKRL